MDGNGSPDGDGRHGHGADDLLLLVVDGEAEAVKLGRFGVPALARPEHGCYTDAWCRRVRGFDLALLRTDGVGIRDNWAGSDVEELRAWLGSATRVATFTPALVQNAPRRFVGLDAVLAHYREVGVGPADLLAQARAALEGPGEPDPDADADPTGPGPGAAAKRYRLTRTSTVTAREVDYLWPDRVPLGMLSLFAGDPKLGKSLTALALAAAVSGHGTMPYGPTRTGSVVILSAEDDLARTIVPRLIAAGADRDKVHVLESVFLADGREALPSLRTDVEQIEAAALEAGDCRLILVDPVSAYLGGTDDHKNAELRGVLSPLKAMAERLDAAVVLISHLNKGGSANPKYRITGSIAYVGASRANYLFIRDPDDFEGRRVLMLSAGYNLGPDPAPLAYTVADGPVLQWEEAPEGARAEEVLRTANGDGGDPEARAERMSAAEFLRDLLGGGRVLANDVEREGREAGFNRMVLHRAKHAIGARTCREGFGRGSRCYWTLE